jgi:hypothetical protein
MGVDCFSLVFLGEDLFERAGRIGRTRLWRGIGMIGIGR